ncbi:amidohydrolase family protein [Sporomusa acidovorans]|uniref:2-pyrone-4,6-dicarbaxylate hydrolase n=1 Tax=Sporomusa acidovorans (strain ATCC 49682 / DSM 3132 / Mol) TaxID=1123286 RepID=A0ABZ3J217_SPOA4|nr:amidohydrolase family protein [Sporomusa acidovorans]OZC16539.1 4-sulfomuconolactone hydrolase [Sporomusa acidovorans DSM 3132]SDF61142.1 Predicted metal-dependent hydrolase, TIM-barrel fold [Sporomusa acidovorans]
MITRRVFVKGAGLALAALSTGGINLQDSFAAEAPKTSNTGAIQVPYSTGRNRPTITVLENACDCHHHIYDPVRFPYVPEDTRNQPPATVDVYRMLQKRLGTTRNVIIQPSAYGTDNSCLLDALKQMGHNSRGVAVIDKNISDSELQKMHKSGVRGIRFNISTGATNDGELILSLAERVNQLGWHVSFWMSADDTVKMADLLQKLPTPIVFDHRGHIPQPAGISHPAFKVICNLIDKGKTWIKLSGLYQDSKVGEPTYSDTVKVGQAYVQYAPERMVWGSDWPHPSEFSARKPMPNDASIMDLLAEQVPDERIRKMILVDNPEALFGFR